jgi:PPM family protein phosphatase
MSDKPLKLWSDGKDFSALQYVGERSSQEDYSQFRLFPSDFGLLAILADGMGGHTSGEVASSNAVEAFDRAFKACSAESPVSKLAAALESANTELSKLIAKNPNLSGMGCTIIGAYLNPKGLYWISVGDSLLYLYRNRQLIQINQDHSMAPLIEESYKLGKLTREEAENYPNKNALRSALMGEQIQLIDAPDKAFDLYHGDVIIVASDGILSLSDKEIRDILEEGYSSSAEKISNNLIQAVKGKRKRNQDNTTIQVIRASKIYKKKPYSKSLVIFLLAGLIGLISIASVFMYNSKARDWVSSIFGNLSQTSEQVQPVAINPEVKKDDNQVLDSSKKSNLGGGLEQSEQQKNDKKKSESKKNDKKILDEKNSKKSDKSSGSSGSKSDNKSEVVPELKKDSNESSNENLKPNKDNQDGKSTEKKEVTKT